MNLEEFSLSELRELAKNKDSIKELENIGKNL